MSNFLAEIERRINKTHDKKKENYSGIIGYVPESYTIDKESHSNVTIDKCMDYARSGRECGNDSSVPCPYMGFRVTSGDRGLCWIPKKKEGSSTQYEYSLDDHTVNKKISTRSSDIPMYMVPADGVDCKDNKNCIRDYELNKLEQMKQKQMKDVEEAQKKASDLAITRIALEKGITFDEAKEEQEGMKKLKKAQDEARKLEKERVDLMQQLDDAKKRRDALKNVMAVTRSQKKTIDDKIDNNFDEISNLNSKILRTSELIDNNNRRFFLKGKVSTVLNWILFILALLAVGMIVYYSAKAGVIKTPKGLTKFVGLGTKNAVKSISKKVAAPAATVTMGKAT